MEWNCKYREGFYIFSRGDEEIYDIPLKKCRTEQAINEWIAHLAEKNWWNQELETRFIKLWKQNNYGISTN